MAYTVSKSDGSTLTNLADGVFNASACSLVLVGRRAVGYGEHFAENFVRLLENFASTTAPTAPLTGQLWYDTSNDTLKIRTPTGANSTGVWNTVASFTSNGTSVTGAQLISTVSAPTPPIVVNSTAKVANLNADLLDGFDSATAATASTVAVRNGSGDLFANLFQGTATSARYADVAERFAASEALEPGDVVNIGGDKEIVKAEGPSVLGVVSTAPAFRMNEDAGDDETHPFVAFIGRVPCKVLGKVKKGDRLIVSGVPGVATASDAVPTQCLVGRALEDKTDDGIGKIMIVVGVK